MAPKLPGPAAAAAGPEVLSTVPPPAPLPDASPPADEARAPGQQSEQLGSATEPKPATPEVAPPTPTATPDNTRALGIIEDGRQKGETDREILSALGQTPGGEDYATLGQYGSPEAAMHGPRQPQTPSETQAQQPPAEPQLSEDGQTPEAPPGQQPSPEPPQAAEDRPERAMNQILDQAATEFFTIRDGERFILTVMARQAVNTPLGQEFRSDVLRMIREVDLSNLVPNGIPQDQRLQSLVSLRRIKTEVIASTPDLTEPKEPGTSAFLDWAENKGLKIPDEMRQQIDLGIEGTPLTVLKLIENLPDGAREDLWQQIMGDAVTMDDFFKPEQMLSIPQINPSKENKEILGEMLHPKEKRNYKGMVLPSLGLGFVLLMMVSQFAQEADRQPSGH